MLDASPALPNWFVTIECNTCSTAVTGSAARDGAATSWIIRSFWSITGPEPGEGFAPPTGEQAISERINIGDNNCRVYLGTPFPDAAEMPSRVNGLENDVLNWARDYAFFLDHNPCEIHPEEEVVGEFHWQLDEARCFRYPDEVHEAGFEARRLGAGGISYAHTCPDLSIGLELGWGGLLNKIRYWKARHEANGNQPAAHYLAAQELVVESIQRWVKRHADRGRHSGKRRSLRTWRGITWLLRKLARRSSVTRRVRSLKPSSGFSFSSSPSGLSRMATATDGWTSCSWLLPARSGRRAHEP